MSKVLATKARATVVTKAATKIGRPGAAKPEPTMVVPISRRGLQQLLDAVYVRAAHDPETAEYVRQLTSEVAKRAAAIPGAPTPFWEPSLKGPAIVNAFGEVIRLASFEQIDVAIRKREAKDQQVADRFLAKFAGK
jgi:hypothetical protein